MAFGVLILACRLRSDSYAMQPNLATAHYCAITGKKNSISNDGVANSTNETGATLTVPIFVSIKSDVYYDFTNKSARLGGGMKWTGTLHDGQLGLRGADANSTLQLEVLLESAMPHNCVDDNCEYMLVHACALVHGVAEDYKKAHSTVEEETGQSGCSNAKTASGADSLRAILLNQIDYSDSVDRNRFATTRIPEKWCQDGSVVSLQKRDGRGFVLIPLLHDTLTARLHLLYTSYFLFTTILILIIYATCRRASHTKQIVRTPESNYSKLSNERE